MSDHPWQPGAGASDDGAVGVDLRFLDDVPDHLLGYFMKRWFGGYLGLIYDTIGRYAEAGLMQDLVTTAEPARFRFLFDFAAIDHDKLSYVNGMYFYVLAAHKSANHALMHTTDRAFVLYLRGYDYESAVEAAPGAALGMYSTSTSGFTATIGDALDPNEYPVDVFKVMSSLDMWLETISAQNHFVGEYDQITAMAGYPIRSFYMNGARWQRDIETLLDRMDHFVVYVSSITASVMWELDQLDRDGRRDRVTVVFDEEAIANKVLQTNMQQWEQGEFGDRVLWGGAALPTGMDVDSLRTFLAERFVIATPEEFDRDVDQHRDRILASRGPLGPGHREMWLDFHFEPTVDAESRRLLDGFSEYLDEQTVRMIDEMTIDCLPLFLNLVQLRIFTALATGDHHTAGVALARYTAVIDAVFRYYSEPGDRPGQLSEGNRDSHLSTLDDHRYLGEWTAWFMLSFGRSHEFGDYRASARETYDAEFERTTRAVGRFIETLVANSQG